MGTILQSASLSLLREKFEGRRFVLVGNGPSLDMRDLDFLRENNICSYGVNKIFLSYEATSWRPTIYSSTDHAILQSIVENMSNTHLGHIILPLSMKEKIDDCHALLGSIFINHLSRSCHGYERLFSKDASKVTYGGYTVLFFALQILYSLGVRDVCLIGVDHNYSMAETRLIDEVSHNGRLIEHISGSNHFHPHYFTPGEIAGDVYPDESRESFEMARIAFEEGGGRVVNCTNDSKLDVFEMSSLRHEFA